MRGRISMKTDEGSDIMSKPSALAFAAKGPAYLGRGYDEMDCRDLINAMLSDVGVETRYKGSNALWRDVAWRGTPGRSCRRVWQRPCWGAAFHC